MNEMKCSEDNMSICQVKVEGLEEVLRCEEQCKEARRGSCIFNTV